MVRKLMSLSFLFLATLCNLHNLAVVSSPDIAGAINVLRELECQHWSACSAIVKNNNTGNVLSDRRTLLPFCQEIGDS